MENEILNPCEGCPYFQLVEVEREASGPTLYYRCVASDDDVCPLDAQHIHPEVTTDIETHRNFWGY